MRVSLIGPGNIDFHYKELLKISDDDLKKHLDEIGEALASSGVEIELLPDKGVSMEIAKLYHKKSGKKIIASVPEDDKTFGVKHLGDYKENKLFDEVVNTGDWFKHDMIKGLMGDVVLYLGRSPGCEIERNSGVYLYKLFNGFDGMEIARKKVHSEIKANEGFTIFVYSPFLNGGKLSVEDEVYMKSFEINLVYVKDGAELVEGLKKVKI